MEEQFESNPQESLDEFFSEIVASDAPASEEPDFDLGYDVSNENPDYREPEDFFNKGPKEDNSDDDYIKKYLAARGIDADNIKINNNGVEEKVSFDDLSEGEKLDILETSDTSAITDVEIQDINTLRDLGLSLNEYTDLVRNHAMLETQQQQNQIFSADAYSDDELYIIDFMNRFGVDLTDEEYQAELDKAKEDEVMFARKIESIRNAYREREAQIVNAYEQEQQRQYNVNYSAYMNSIVDAVNNLNEMQAAVVDNDDKQRILDFLTVTDAANRTEFSKLMSDPDALVKLAWYYLYGDAAQLQTIDYFKNELAKSRGGSHTPHIVNKYKGSNRKKGELDELDKYFN